MMHVVKNQIICILLNERPRDISLVPQLRDLICRVYPSVNDVSVLFTLFRDENSHSAFQTTYD